MASNVIEVTTSILKIGEDMPFVGGLCTAVLNAKDMVDKANDNQVKLEKLCERCCGITVQVIEKLQGATSMTINVSPLEGCVKELEEVAERYGKKCCCTRLAHFRKDDEDIRDLEKRTSTAIDDLTAAGVVEVGNLVLQQLGEILARLQPRPRPKLAPVPPGLPAGEAWHAVRDHVQDEVYKILSGDEPAVAALTGRSGAGKSTAAANMVRNRKVDIRGLDDETEDQARTRMDRLERVRARFSDGVVYLRVGKGEGAADRLPDLMRKLAKALYEDVMKKTVGAPEAGEDGESYVKKMVTRKKKRCLVVADDVWEPQVIAKLKETGMWVLLTTRFLEIVEPNEGVDVDQLTPAEAEDVVRGAADLPPGQRLCDAAIEVLDGICGFVAMDIAFVGSWSTLRTADSEAWAEAVSKIKDTIDDVREDADGMEDRQVKRLAVLRTGFDYLGEEEGTLAQKLYVALAVFPDDHAFGVSDAAVLLNDTHPPAPAPHHMKVASRAIEILERWAVLTMDASEKYRMHDAHVDFSRDELRGWDKFRKQVVRRWTSHISRLDFAVRIDVYALLRMWRAMERVGGGGWWVTRPYDDQLVHMDASNPSRILAVHIVAELYEHDEKFGELEPIMTRVLEHRDVHGGDSPEVQTVALYF